MKVPKHLTLLGFITQIKYFAGDLIVVFDFPKRGKNRMLLCCNATGHKIYGFRAPEKKSLRIRKGSRNFDRCAYKFEQWSDFTVDSVEKATIRSEHTTFAGEISEISYISDKWTGKLREYFHQFENRTLLHMDNDDDPELIVLSGKSLRVTEKGIEG